LKLVINWNGESKKLNLMPNKTIKI